MCDVDTALAVIQSYILDNYLNSDADTRDLDFQMKSYRQWAAYEICNLIMDRPYENPVNIIDEFMLKMSVYINYDSDNIIFQTALKTAEELILLFI